VTGLAFLAALLSGLAGVVSRGPVTPVCRQGMPCSKPYPHATLLFSRAGVTKRVVTDEKGAYRISLVPGRYGVRVAQAQFGSRPTSAFVPRGRYAELNISVDTGIR
jgi:carboxypeptidase family protein